jgi:ABC-type multidrug transport system fused ATPase/permease subunit
MMVKDTIAAKYLDRIARFDASLTELCRHDRLYSLARGFVFLISLALAFAGWFGWAPPFPMFVMAGVFFVGFVAVVGFHEAMRDRLARIRARRVLDYRQLARYERDWSKLPIETPDVAPEQMAAVADLDLLGASSVYQWLCRAHTPRGRALLRDWLLAAPSVDEIAERQAAVQRLAGERAIRDDIDLHGYLLSGSESGPEGFVQWAEGPAQYKDRVLLRWVVRGLALVTITLPIVMVFRGLPPSGWLLMIGLLAVNILVNAVFVGAIHELFNRITAGRNELAHYGKLFGIVDQLPTDDPKLASLREKLNRSDVNYESAFGELKRIMFFAGGRKSATFGIPYVFIQVLVFWDFHVLEWLESWQARYGSHVSGWFDAVAELEVLASLANMAADHPAWPYPDVSVDGERFKAQEIGHPLLKRASCKRNDVELGPSGTFLLITGSNMSGKSTLLRSIGVNAVLAQTGAPVCATRLSMPRVELATSMRVTDSLDDGVSFFLAELKRLKSIVDQSRAIDKTDGTRLLFLLDEILQGTNSAERQIAVAKVISHLVRQPAIGAVSTHDLELADDQQLKECCHTVHFREQFTETDGKREMSFDYQLREGVSPTTNALKLLELVGLGDQ